MESSLAISLGDVSRRLQAVLRRHLVAEGIGLDGTRVLLILEREPRSVAELATTRQVSDATMLALLDRLESRGFLTRSQDAAGRFVVVTITEQGRDRLRAILRHLATVLDPPLASLEPSEREAIEKAIPALVHLVERLEVETGPPRKA